MDRVYPPVRTSTEPNDHIWLSFFSTDRSKLSMEDYIILKKNVGVGASQINEDNKFKVIDIKNEAPDAVKYGEYLDVGSVANTASTSSGVLNQDIFDDGPTRPKKDRNLLKINKQNCYYSGIYFPYQHDCRLVCGELSGPFMCFFSARLRRAVDHFTEQSF